jgi:hypothetical protein
MILLAKKKHMLNKGMPAQFLFALQIARIIQKDKKKKHIRYTLISISTIEKRETS